MARSGAAPIWEDPMSPDNPRARRRVTLTDVARRSGVSPALASIVLREAPGASDASRRRVLAAAKELGYRPDVRARSLARLGPHVIGVVFGRAGRFPFEIIDGLYSAAEEQGWDLVLSALTSTRDESRAVESLRDHGVDALVMLGPPTPAPEAAGDLPVVTIGWHVDHPDVDVVRISDDLAMTLAVDHLTGLGHREIAFLSGGPGTISASRQHAYEEAMRSAGLATRARVIPCDGDDQLDGQRAALRMVRARRRLPSAVVAFNDDLAAATIGVLTQHGVDVPRQVSVIGVDDSALASSPAVSLTSVRQDANDLARQAVERVVARCTGAEVGDREIVLEPRLTVRSTTARASR